MNQFPDLHQAVLDDETLTALFADVRAFGSDIEALPRRKRRTLTEEKTLPLAEALAGLQQGDLLGVQLRYEHDGQRWFDTITRAADGWKIVRLNASQAARPVAPTPS